MRYIRIRRGIDFRFGPAPEQQIRSDAAVSRVALLGADFPALRPVFCVEEGARVRAGTPLFFDRRAPTIAHVAPVAGTVREIVRGRRRMLDRIVIEREGEDSESFAVPATLDRVSLTELLAAAGAWTAFSTRPFRRTPEPGTVPGAIFATAIDTRPLSPDPTVAIGEASEAFRAGLDALCILAAGAPVFLCQARSVLLPMADGVIPVAFSGPHPAGLPSTHIHHLHPVGGGRTVWQICYDDVLSIGHLLLTGRVRTTRIISLAGPLVSSPALLRTVPGAALRELAAGSLAGRKARLLSGSPLDGRPQPFLGRFALQVSALAPPSAPRRTGTPSERLRAFLRAQPPVLIPRAAHERAAPTRILPAPFLRALGTGDTETAARLGALELCEEDMALLSHLDGVDYGGLLRRTLDDLEAAQ
ncbi:hypothetical protein LUX29_04445 [Aureimonas altamirensis]|uniref:hypothetical protein n=1 Tax=Aureimonas altamirensis TaxID=370622 RepID=UPI001E480E74|nr:hypothetical protein [Aureimonas altamirensis]UHD46474.1 hypothetical protein LUX29_04445 [Aureimonas altamirensis]